MCRTSWSWGALLLGVLMLVLAMVGCGRQPPALPAAKPPEVVVCQPVVKEVTDYEDFTGRIEAVARVEVRARVSGYLEKVLFREGTEVKQGDPLFAIDDRTYRTDLAQKGAIVAQSEARLKRLQSSYERAKGLLPSKAISETDFDLITGDRDEAAAALNLAKAARDMAQLNLDFTTVVAPLSGRISTQEIDPGNMVQADVTRLTTIVTLDPIYVYFDMNEKSMLRIRRLIRAGKIKSSQEAKRPIFLGLMDQAEDGLYPHEGTINFVDNHVDPMTGTLRFRGIFPNDNRILSPGLGARIRLPIGNPRPAILISEQALVRDQARTFVYVVNDKNEVVYRPVKLGSLQDGLRVIEEGLAKEERVVLSGLQRIIRPGLEVKPKLAETPAANSPAAPLATKPDAAPSGRPPS